MRWRIKLKTNDEQRQQFLRQFVPKIYDLGLTLHDKSLRYDQDTKTWLYDDPDWNMFKQVINGGGPASALRLQTRRMAHEDGRWVREALAAATKYN